MANGKTTGNKAGGPKNTPATKEPAADTPKNQVERMFGNGEQPRPQMKVKATLDLPEHADTPDDEISAKDAKDAVDAILSALGTDKFPATQFPIPKRNNGPAAVSYVLWDHVAKFTAKKAKEATKQAEEEGVFGDPDTYVAGETTLVYNAPEFAISIKKGEDTQMVNREQVEEVLKEVAPARWQELMRRCMKPRAGPTQKIVSLK